METNNETENFIDDDPILTLRLLICLYFFRHPRMTARKIYVIWGRSKLLMEYERPQEEILAGWLTDYKELLTAAIKETL